MPMKQGVLKIQNPIYTHYVTIMCVCKGVGYLPELSGGQSVGLSIMYNIYSLVI